jgi:tetratricopeptide (TPR) repeat protein
MLTDARGCPTSAPSSVSLQQYEQALELSLSYQLDPLATIQKALDADPTFAMGHCLRAGLAVMATDRGAVPMLTESVEAIEALGRRAVERERAHAAAARAWLQGDFAGSIQRYGEILLDYPHDLLALQVAHVGDFFLGASSMLRDRLAQVLPTWDTSMPGYGFVLGMYAFGLEETALYSRAEDIGRRALDANRRDAWAVHAVTHVMEMQGRLRDGVEWLTTRENDWSVNNGFAFHNWWHLALFNLESGNYARVLELYDQRIRATPSEIPLEMIDATALLWRLELRSANVGDRWQKLAASWEPLAEHSYYAFNDAHAVMAFAAAGRGELGAANDCGDGTQGRRLRHERNDDARRWIAAGTCRCGVRCRSLWRHYRAVAADSHDRQSLRRQSCAARSHSPHARRSSAARPSRPARAGADRRTYAAQAVEPVQLAADGALDGSQWRHCRCSASAGERGGPHQGAVRSAPGLRLMRA